MNQTISSTDPIRAATTPPLHSTTAPDRQAAPADEGVAVAASHALGWLAAGNAVGLWLATLLLWPAAGSWLGGLAYGRWIPVHLNLQLYGWTSLPLIAWLFAIYQTDSGRGTRWAPAAVWAWSTALACGAVYWLAGRTSGKIFLDWQGGSLAALLAALTLLWLVLARGLASCHRRHQAGNGRRLAGLLLLAAVPPALWHAANPAVYPPVDPATGGPTGVSLLGSTLAVVCLLLLAPRTLSGSPPAARPGARALWSYWFAGLLAFLLLEPLGGRHTDWWQIAALALLLPWPALVALDWRRFEWPPATRPWCAWALAWWALLVLSGWIDFLPGILDRTKFTSSLVAHSHLAMAGFTSAFCILLLACLSPRWSQVVQRGHAWWNGAVLLHVAALAVAGWIEGGDRSWMLETTGWRYACFGLRWFAGATMLAASIRWWLDWRPSRRKPSLPCS